MIKNAICIYYGLKFIFNNHAFIIIDNLYCSKIIHIQNKICLFQSYVILSMIYFFISFQNYLAMSALSRKDAVIPENSPKGFRICIH